VKLTSVSLPAGTPRVPRASGGFLRAESFDLTYADGLIRAIDKRSGSTLLIHPAGCVMEPAPTTPRKATREAG